MASSEEEETCEEVLVQELEQLCLKREDAASATPPSDNVDGVIKMEKLPELDSAVIEALSSQERTTVAELEEIVIMFIGDTARDILEFSPTLGTYQKMLAHRIAQAYGLQTSTVDYEEGPGRVIGKRTKDSCLRQVKLTQFDATAAMAQRQGSHAAKLQRRPPGPEHARSSPIPQSGYSLLNLKERADDYHRIRERVIGRSGSCGSAPVGSPNTGSLSGGSSSNFGQARFGGRGEGAGSGFGSRDKAGRGSGRKTVLRDKDQETQEPEYALRNGDSGPFETRGFGGHEGSQDYARRQQQPPQHPQHPHHQKQHWDSVNRQYSPGPAPLPPPPNKAHEGSPHQGSTHQFSHAPAMGGMQPMPRPSSVMYPGMPVGMPMVPYPMAGYPGGMSYPGAMSYPGGMPGQQHHMYAAAHGMSAYPHAGMQMSGSPQGYYPMYAGPGFMYPQQMAAMQMQPSGRSIPGMQEMCYPAPQYGAHSMPTGNSSGYKQKQQKPSGHGQGLHSARSGPVPPEASTPPHY